MSVITDTKAPPRATSYALINWCIDDVVQTRLGECSYRFVFDKISWQFENGTLTLCGTVPSFYLKQVLQELLRDIRQIDQIVNDVDVVSSNGLSSDRPSKPR